jgi:hypothetical protein
VVIAAFKALSKQLIVIAAIIGASALIVLLTGGQDAAMLLLATAVVGMKAPWVWTFGYGPASFVADRGRALPTTLNGFLAPTMSARHSPIPIFVDSTSIYVLEISAGVRPLAVTPSVG